MTVVVESGQSLVDIAVQAYGTADALAIICEANNLEFDTLLQAGMLLVLPNVLYLNPTQIYFKNLEVKVNSHLAEVLPPTGFDYTLDLIL